MSSKSISVLPTYLSLDLRGGIFPTKPNLT